MGKMPVFTLYPREEEFGVEVTVEGKLLGQFSHELDPLGVVRLEWPDLRAFVMDIQWAKLSAKEHWRSALDTVIAAGRRQCVHWVSRCCWTTADLSTRLVAGSRRTNRCV